MTITDPGVVLSRCDPARPREVRRFLAAAHHVHEHCFPESRWVAPLMSEVRHYLDPVKNPLFGHATVALWVASLRGRVVGSIAAVDDADWRLHQRRDGGSFGFFECVDSPAVAAELLGAATDWLRGRGLRHMIGPFNLTTNYTTGFLADNFGSEPTFMMPYNPPYYLELMEACGLRKAKELWEWSVPLDGGVPPSRLARLTARIARTTDVRVREADASRWNAESETIRDLYNRAWQDNWAFVPQRADEFAYVAKDLKPLLSHSVVVLAEAPEGPLGFLLALPDLNPRIRPLHGSLLSRHTPSLVWSALTGRGIESCRVALLGVVPEGRRAGIAALLLDHAFRSPAAAGWRRATMGWADPENIDISRTIEAVGGRQSKSFAVFDTALEP